MAIKNLLKKPDTKQRQMMFWLFLTALICFLHALSAGHYADFYPINGTFQNFNPVRRLLAGQVPYRDFVDYLGMGHLFAGGVFTALFGGNYLASLRAFSFLALFSLALIVLVLGAVILKDRKRAGILSTAVLCMVLVRPSFYEYFLTGKGEITAALAAALETGNSARFLRGAAPVVFVFFCLLFAWIRNKISVSDKVKVLLEPVAMGAASGLIFLWSNDYGACVWLASILLYIWVNICRRSKLPELLKNTALMVVSSVVAAFLAVEVLTLGHFGAWYNCTFGTGSYQRWYYNSDKSFFLYQINAAYITLCQGFLVLAYALLIFKNRGSAASCRRYGIPALFNLAGLGAIEEYRLLSGGNLVEVAYSILFVTVLCELTAALLSGAKNLRLQKAMAAACAVAACALVASTAMEELYLTRTAKSTGTYVEGLGGNSTQDSYRLNEAAQFLGGEKVFSTYASALEVMTDQYQPSGVDYIIHVLGDRARDNYLAAFRKGGFAYAATIKDTFDEYEAWIRDANWFFYRELLDGYAPVYASGYELFWQKTDTPHIVTDGISVETAEDGNGGVRICVTADERVNGLADVYVSYETEDVAKSLLVFQKMVCAQRSTNVFAGSEMESNYLRPASGEFIPVTILNGYGEVTLKSLPEQLTRIRLNGAECSKIYTANFDFAAVDWVSRVDNGLQVALEWDNRNPYRLKGAKKIRLNGVTFPVAEVQAEESGVVTLDTDMTTEAFYDLLLKGNQCEILR